MIGRYYVHPFTGKKKKIGGVKTKRCYRCDEDFFPSRDNQKLCPYCQERPSRYNRLCSLFGCENKHFARGFCQKHYEESRKEKRVMQRKMAKAKKHAGSNAVICKLFKECEVYFVPIHKNRYGKQKYCSTCSKKLRYGKTKKTR